MSGFSDTSRTGLASLSFVGLLATQFLVALNDNMFRWLVMPIGKVLLVAPGVSAEAAQNAALAWGSVCFLLPFVLLAAPAGYLANRFSKRSVMIGCKVAEIVLMFLAVAAILSGNFYLILGALALLASQAALFSPAKLAAIPEIVGPDRIAAANGMIAMTTMVAIILGSLAGGFLFNWTTSPELEGVGGRWNMVGGDVNPDMPHATCHLPLPGPGQYHWWIAAAALLGVATAGLVASLWIGRLRPANPGRRLPWNFFAETFRDLRTLAAHRPLLLAALGGTFFWSLGAMAQINIDKFARPELVSEQKFVGPLLAMLILGIGVGGLTAGLVSRGRIELGLVPLGALGMAAASILLCYSPQGTGDPNSAAYYWACLWLFLLGVAAGLFDIPLEAYLQHHSPVEVRGSILAAYNFLSFSGMLLAAVLFWLLASKLGLSARHISLLAGLASAAAAAVILCLVPRDTLRLLARLVGRPR